MHHTILMLSVLSTFAVGCSKGDSSPPKPFTGKLTIERVMALTMQSVQNCEDPWDLALAKVEGKLGKPTKIDGEKFQWAAIEGERCAIVTIERGECPPSWNKPGPRLYSVYEAVETTPTSEVGNHAACLKTASGS